MCVCCTDRSTGVGRQPVPYWPVQDLFPCGRAGPPGGGERPEADRHHCAVPGPGSGPAGPQVSDTHFRGLLGWLVGLLAGTSWG